MKGLVCKYCGGNHFNKTEEGYECTYCHAVYEADDLAEINDRRPTNKKSALRIALIVAFALVLGSSFFVLHSTEKTEPTQKATPFVATVESSSSGEAAYSASQLNNPERNVRIAELSLNSEEIKLAKASVKEYGGKKTKELEQRIQAAEKEHDKLAKTRPQKPPKDDMIIENPDSELAVTTYYREAGFLAAYGPDFDQYSSADILRIWGQPDKIITDVKQIKNTLSIKLDENNKPATYETKVLLEQWQKGLMTWREVMSFQIFIKDNFYANFTKKFVYEEQGKPNVYFEDDHVGYVTPVLRYVSFTRLPEKYPRAGLGKYPDDFPENYGSDGLYHEK